MILQTANSKLPHSKLGFPFSFFGASTAATTN